MENLPSIFLDTLHVLTHKVLTRTLWGQVLLLCIFYSEDNETQQLSNLPKVTLILIVAEL